MTRSDDATEVAGRITGSLEQPFVVGEHKLFVDASVGIALSTSRTTGPADLLRDADTAMYLAKEEHAGFRVFDPAMHERVLNRLGLENDLRNAIGRDEFFSPRFAWRATLSPWSRPCCAGNIPRGASRCRTTSSPWPRKPA